MTDSTELNSKPVVMIRPDDYVATAPTGAAVIEVDTLGYKWLTITAAAGVLTGGTSITVTVEDSATTGSGHAAITGAAFSTFTTTNDVAKYGVIDCHKHERYVQLSVVFAGTYSVSEFGVSGLLHSSQDPAFSQAAEFAV